MTAVMQGIRVLEVAEHTFVPAASAILSDWGADIIKVEPAERGDAMRGIMSTGNIGLGGGAWHPLLQHSNRGKRSIGLDLSTPEGVDILYKLAATCDVFLTNKLPAVRSKLRIDVEDIRAVNPSIIYVRGSGFGSRGPMPTAADTTCWVTGVAPESLTGPNPLSSMQSRASRRRPTEIRSAP